MELVKVRLMQVNLPLAELVYCSNIDIDREKGNCLCRKFSAGSIRSMPTCPASWMLWIGS